MRKPKVNRIGVGGRFFFDARMDAQQTRCDESVPATGISGAVERDGEQSIECCHGGSEHDRPVCGVESRIP